jgi:voltage-gated sodium channel
MNIFKKITTSTLFQSIIIFTIFVAGAQVGLETMRDFAEKNQDLLSLVDMIILIIFVIEAALKILAEGKQPWKYFKDPWNIFDFTIITFCIFAQVLLIHAEFIMVLRLVRILRLFRIITILPDLQLIVGTLLRSIPSMFYLALLLLLLFYVYGAIAVFIFGDNDPIHFKNLPTSMLSMFRVATLEDWTDIMYINMYGSANYGYSGNEHLTANSVGRPIFAAFFFVSFVAVGTMIVLNLVIGVIINSMEETKKERIHELQKKAKEENGITVKDHLLTEMEELSLRIFEIKKEIERMD